MRSPSVVFAIGLVLCFASGAAGCGRSLKDSCQILCEKGAECDTDAPPVETCVATCKDLADDDADYADGVDRRAECYEDVEPACNQRATCDYVEE